MIIASGRTLGIVYYMCYKENTGTCFAISYGDRKYLVTAKHMFENYENCADIYILKEGEFIKYSTKIYYHDNEMVDVVVMENNLLNDISAIPVTNNQPELFIGQELYFAGFPFGLNPEQYDCNNGFPVPFVKKAIVSSVYFKNGFPLLWLDGINNPGFSGGPVVYNVTDKETGRIYDFIGGVISSYKCDLKQVYNKEGLTEEGLFYRENSGIINVHGTKCIIDIIDNIQSLN